MLRRTAARVLVVLLVTASIASAQSGTGKTAAGSATATVLVRADDDIVLHVDSPQRIRTLFRVTNLGAVLGDERGADIRSKLAAGLLPDESSDAALRTLLLRLLDSDATLDIGVHLDGDKPEELDADGVIVLTPGKGLDAQDLARGIGEALRGRGLEVDKVEVDGESYQKVHEADGTAYFTLPVVRDGRLVAVLGEHLEAAIARRMAKTSVPAWTTPDPDWRAAPVALHVDLRKIAAGVAGSSRPKQVKAQMEATGLDSLRAFRLLVRAAGPNIEIDSRLSFDERDARGLFAGIFTDRPQPPALAGLATADAVDWVAGKYDFEAFARAAYRVVASWSVSIEDGGDVDAQVEDMHKQSKQFFGCDLERDLGAALANDFFVGDSHAFVPSVPAPGGQQDGEPAASGFVFATTSRGPQMPAGLLRDLCRSQIGHWLDLEGDPQAVEGVDVIGAEDLRLASSGKDFALAGGPSAELAVARALKRARAIDGSKDVPLPPILERVRRRFAPGYQGCGVIDLGSVASVVLFQVRGFWLLDDELPSAKQWQSLVDQLRAPLHELDLDRVAITTGYAEHAFTLRVHW